MPVTARLRVLVARYGTIIAILLGVLSVAAFAAAGTTYTDPPKTTETYITSQQEFTTEVETSARVTNTTALYSKDERLENMPAYFFSATPNLTYHIRTTIPDGVTATVTKRLTLQLEATRNGDPFWQTQQLLATERTTTTNTTWTNTTVNMSRIQALVAEKRAAVGSVGTLSVTHRLNVTYQTDQYQGTLTATTPLITTNRAYWLDGSLTASRTHTETSTRTITGTPNLVLVTALTALGFALLTVAGSVILTAREYDIDTLQEEIARAEYDQWISNGELPTKSEKEYIRVDSIEDVVDIAIDSNKRVIYDTDLDVYAVVEDDIVYFYTTSTDAVSDWLDV